MSEIRRFLPVVFLGAGIVLGPSEPSLRARVLLALLAGGTVAVLGARGGRSARRRRALVSAAWAAALVVAGGCLAEREDVRHRAPLRLLPSELAFDGPEGRQVWLEGRFESDPEPVDAARWRAAFVAEHLEDHGLRAPFAARVQLTWPALPGERGPAPLAGRHASLTARLRLPRSFGNPGSFDMEEHLERHDTLALGWIKSARLIHFEGESPPQRAKPGANVEEKEEAAEGAMDSAELADLASRPSAGAPSRAPLSARVRRRYDRIFDRLSGGEHAAGASGPLSPEIGVLRASVLGGRTGLDPETERRLVASGVYHILAVSGLQVALLASVLLFVLRRTPAPPGIVLIAGAASALGYGTIVAPSPSVGRAVAMLVLAASARLLHRPTPAAALLALTALGRLALRPSELGDPGFQLTFAATAGLLLLGPRLAPRLRARWGMGSLLKASAAAQAATWPLVAAWFHRVVPYGLAANLLAVPLGSLAVVLGVLLLPADLVSARLADGLGAAALVAVKGLLAVAEVPVEGSCLSFRVAAPHAALLATSAAGLVGLAVARRRAAVAASAALTAAALVLIVADPWPRRALPPLTGGAGSAADRGSARTRLGIDLIDVGQGDAVLVSFEDGETMLVDGGGFPGSTFDVGARVLVPELERRGLSRLGRVVLTHAHEDHGGGLREVLRSLSVGELLVPDAPQGPLRAELEAVARARGVRVRRIRRGFTIREGTTTVRCLAPFPGVTDGPNADSVVLRLEAGERSALLTGDIVAATERRLLAADLEPADILKVAHHGSDSSSLADFLSRTSPRVALISVGEANRFGHPSPRVLARLNAVHALVLRTDRDGAVRVDALGGPGGALYAGSVQDERPSPWPGPPLRPREGGRRTSSLNLDRDGDEADDED